MSTNQVHSDLFILRGLRYAHALFRGVLILLLVLILLNAYFITIFRVDGHSMEETLHDRQLLAVNLTAYWFSLPKKGDVVIVQYAGDTDVRFVKRIVGTPGSTVSYNGISIQLKDDEYFVVGDNRDHSTDSRVYGPVHKKQILGKVFGNHPYDVPLE